MHYKFNWLAKTGLPLKRFLIGDGWHSLQWNKYGNKNIENNCFRIFWCTKQNYNNLVIIYNFNNLEIIIILIDLNPGKNCPAAPSTKSEPVTKWPPASFLAPLWVQQGHFITLCWTYLTTATCATTKNGDYMMFVQTFSCWLKIYHGWAVDRFLGNY